MFKMSFETPQQVTLNDYMHTKVIPKHLNKNWELWGRKNVNKYNKNKHLSKQKMALSKQRMPSGNPI